MIHAGCARGPLAASAMPYLVRSERGTVYIHTHIYIANYGVGMGSPLTRSLYETRVTELSPREEVRVTFTATLGC